MNTKIPLMTTGSDLTKKSILIDEFDTYFNLNLLTHTGETYFNKGKERKVYSWNSLEIEIYQKTDTTFVNKLTLNTVRKQDLLNLSAAFAELAAAFAELAATVKQ